MLIRSPGLGTLDLLGTLDGLLENYEYYDTAPVTPAPTQTKDSVVRITILNWS